MPQGQDRTEQDRTGQDRDKTGQGRTGHLTPQAQMQCRVALQSQLSRRQRLGSTDGGMGPLRLLQESVNMARMYDISLGSGSGLLCSEALPLLLLRCLYGVARPRRCRCTCLMQQHGRTSCACPDTPQTMVCTCIRGMHARADTSGHLRTCSFALATCAFLPSTLLASTSGLPLPLPFSAACRGTWQGKEGYTSLKALCPYVRTAGMPTH